MTLSATTTIAPALVSSLPTDDETEFWHVCEGNQFRDAERFRTYLQGYRGNVNCSHYYYSHRTGLHFAVEGNKPEFVAELLAVEGIDPNRRNSEQETPLALACRLRYHQVIAVLLRDPRVDVNGGGEGFNKPMDWVIRLGEPRILRMLIASGKPLPSMDSITQYSDPDSFSTWNAEVVALLQEYHASPEEEAVAKARAHPDLAPSWL